MSPRETIRHCKKYWLPNRRGTKKIKIAIVQHQHLLQLQLLIVDNQNEVSNFVRDHHETTDYDSSSDPSSMIDEQYEPDGEQNLDDLHDNLWEINGVPMFNESVIPTINEMNSQSSTINKIQITNETILQTPNRVITSNKSSTPTINLPTISKKAQTINNNPTTSEKILSTINELHLSNKNLIQTIQAMNESSTINEIAIAGLVPL